MDSTDCVGCGKPFMPSVHNQKTCSEDCRHAKNRKRDHEYHKSHQMRDNECSRKYRETHRDELREKKHKHNEAHRDKNNKLSHEYHAAHRNEINERSRKYNEAHQDEIQEYAHKYYKLHQKEISKRRKTRNHDKKTAAHTKLNRSDPPQCQWQTGCDVTDIDCLEIDHIHNNGAEMRWTGQRAVGLNTYKDVMNMDNPHSKYQSLCTNHNWEKMLRHGEEKRIARWAAMTPERRAKVKINRASQMKIKKMAHDHISDGTPHCVNPGCLVTNPKHLTIDHVNNDGSIDRKILGHGGDTTYRRILGMPKSEAGIRYKILCRNCNRKKEIIRRLEVECS